MNHDPSASSGRWLAHGRALVRWHLAGALLCACGSGGNGAAKTTTPPRGGGQICTIVPAANEATFTSPFDAAPSADGSAVYFTALAADGTGGVFLAGKNVVYRVTLEATPQITTLTQTISQFAEPAGLHRAAAADIYAWADSQANRTGTVYALSK